MNNVFFPFVVDGSPVSVQRHKAIFEHDQLSAERAREPGTHFKLFKQYKWEIYYRLYYRKCGRVVREMAHGCLISKFFSPTIN